MAVILDDEDIFESPKEVSIRRLENILFRPSRFLQNKNLEAKTIAFGIGKRACLGESLARVELFLVRCRSKRIHAVDSWRLAAEIQLRHRPLVSSFNETRERLRHIQASTTIQGPNVAETEAKLKQNITGRNCLVLLALLAVSWSSG